MELMLLVPVLLVITFISPINSLSCMCEGYSCPELTCDISGYAPTPCGCCLECAKAINQTCGGPWNFDGVCDKNLTCNTTDSDYPYFEAKGRCTDESCQAQVDFTFLLDGSWHLQNFEFSDAVSWSRQVIKGIYEVYGACARIAIAQYGGMGSKRRLTYPVQINQCTNNNDCVKRKVASYQSFNLYGKQTFSALNGVLKKLQENSRGPDSEKVIVIITHGGTADSSLSEQWQKTSNGEVITYALQVGASMEELVNITNDTKRIIDHSDVKGFIKQMWRDTVDGTGCFVGEEYVNCSTTCEPTCENPYPTCDDECGPSACQCRQGYVRLDGSCILQHECFNSEKKCEKACPMMTRRASFQEKVEIWLCILRNWFCLLFNW